VLVVLIVVVLVVGIRVETATEVVGAINVNVLDTVVLKVLVVICPVDTKVLTMVTVVVRIEFMGCAHK
jgi:hypothetical protein